jgi:hypothetical protein
LPLDPNNLPISSSETLLIVADDASLIAEEINKAVQQLRSANKQHVLFLLSSQKLTWQDTQIANFKWGSGVLKTLPLSGISEPEAKSIVSAWAKCGDEGLGRLKNTPPDSRWRSFYDEARSGSGQGSSFFGAALTIRYSQTDLEKHITALLDRLFIKDAKEETVPDGATLVKALAVICAVDCINAAKEADDLKLSTEIFAHLFRCEPGEVRKKFVIPLGDEAVANSSRNTLYSRHQNIARVVIDHIEPFGISFQDICSELVKAASYLHTQEVLLGIDMIPWNRLPRWFFKQDVDKDLGIRLVKDFIRAEPKNPVFFVDLSTFCRDLEQPEASVNMLRASFGQVNVDRKYYYEWATAEGYVGNKKQRGEIHYFKDIWLSGVSLADIIHKKYAMAKTTLPYKDDPVDVERATLSLAGLAAALSNFLGEEDIFLHACASSVRLGLLLNPNRDVRPSAKNQTSNSLHGNKSKCEEKGIVFPHQKLTKDDCLKELSNIKLGIVAAYLQCKDELPPDVPKGDKLTFNKLTQRVSEYCAKT